MLVLNRYCDQEICIGDDIVVKVLRIKAGTVRLGIIAPGSVSILRAELPRNDDRNEGSESVV